jgi:hypothetical protein
VSLASDTLRVRRLNGAATSGTRPGGRLERHIARCIRGDAVHSRANEDTRVISGRKLLPISASNG